MNQKRSFNPLVVGSSPTAPTTQNTCSEPHEHESGATPCASPSTRCSTRQRDIRTGWAVLAFTCACLFSAAALTSRAEAAIASCYGPGLWGNHTASGSILQRGTLGVAHKTLPFGTRLHIRSGGVTTTAKVIDRGPFVAGRVLDLTEATAGRLGASSCRSWGHRSVRSWRAR